LFCVIGAKTEIELSVIKLFSLSPLLKNVSYVSGLKCGNNSPSTIAVTEPPFYYTTVSKIDKN